MSTTSAPARSNRPRRATCVASVVPLPGSASPIASARQFIELAVNMPEHDPQVGQAASSIDASSSSDTDGSAEATMESIRSSFLTPAGAVPPATVPPATVPPATVAPAVFAMTLPASIGPPETNTVGMFSRIAAISMPGVILSQLETQIIASAQCALTMYSTESAISSRDGSEYSIPPWPIAMPSSTAIVLNSRGIAPAALTASATTRPTSWRCTWPGTNSVKLFATAMMGLPTPSLPPRGARGRARAPAMFLPCVTVRDLSGGMPTPLPDDSPGQFPESSAYRCEGPRRPDVRQHAARRVVDGLDLLLGQPRQVEHPAAALQILPPIRTREHVDVLDGRDAPGDLRPVDGHRGVDGDVEADRGRQPLAGLLRLPLGVLEALLLVLWAVPELLAVVGADRHPLVPAL